MFSEQIIALMSGIGATAADLAALAGFDRTNISRFRSGKRVPAPDSLAVAKLINAIYLFSDNRNDLKTLCRLTKADENDTADVIRNSIKNYLYDGYEQPISASIRSLSGVRKNSGAFSERLSISMELSGLSNIRLSRLVHSDPSLISRYRSGVRTPSSNSEHLLLISGVLYDRIIKAGREQELAGIMKLPVSEIDEEVYSSWLLNHDEKADDNALTAEKLLEAFDSYTVEGSPVTPDAEEVMRDALMSDEDVSYGISGLRSLVLRFLATAVKTGAKKLYLYSDENQDWLTADLVFLAKWTSLMIACIKGGTRICIIHNTDRSLGEMNSAIRSWLPLYMSGMIESYSCKKQRNSRFSHTLFLMPHTACIRSFGVASAPSGHIYHYHADNRSLELLQVEYDALLESSTPLMKPLPATDYPEVSDVYIVQSRLSIATMSSELAESFESPALMNVWEKARRALLDKLETNLVCECIPLAAKEMIPAGGMRVSHALTGDLDLTYSPAQYSMHIRCIIDLLDRYGNYRFYPIPEPPFPNIDLIISDRLTRITPAIRPGLAFSFEDPSLCLAFENYAGTLMDKWAIDKNSLKKMLDDRY